MDKTLRGKGEEDTYQTLVRSLVEDNLERIDVKTYVSYELLMQIQKEISVQAKRLASGFENDRSNGQKNLSSLLEFRDSGSENQNMFPKGSHSL